MLVFFFFLVITTTCSALSPAEDRLLTWFTTRGGSWSPSISFPVDYFEQGGNGVGATEAIRHGDVLLRIPMKLIMWGGWTGPVDLLEAIARVPSHERTALALTYQFSLGERSEYAPFVEATRETELEHVAMWGDEELEELQDRVLKGWAKGYRGEWKASFRRMQEHLRRAEWGDKMGWLTEDVYRHCLYIVLTRSFNVVTDNMDHMVVPVAHYVNHHPLLGGISWRAQKVNGESFFVFQWDGPNGVVQPGDQVFTQYGPSSDYFTLRGYGFVDPANPSNFAEVWIPRRGVQIDLYRDKVRAWNGHAHTKMYKVLKPWRVLKFFRIVAATEEDVDSESGIKAYRAVSVDSEVRALEACQDMFQLNVRQLPTTLEQDEAEVKMANGRRATAIWYRIGRKQIFNSHFKFCSAAKELLKCTSELGLRRLRVKFAIMRMAI